MNVHDEEHSGQASVGNEKLKLKLYGNTKENIYFPLNGAQF